MACFRPHDGWLHVDGGRPLWNFPVGDDPMDYSRTVLVCRSCPGCLADRARDISLRAVHEAKVCGASCFLTLTYDNDHLPLHGSLCRRDLELFMKRLRFRLAKPVRAYAVGEYGGRTLRPHYHLCLFGEDFWFDRRSVGQSFGGFPMWESPFLDEVWGKGFCRVNDMGVDVAGYAAKYAIKAHSDGQGRAPRRCDADGVWHDVERPFDSLPRGKALGVPFLDRFWSDVFPRGVVVLRGGAELPAPRAYLRVFSERDPDGFAELMERRSVEGFKPERFADSLPSRLAVRERVMVARVTRRAREL